MHNKTEINNIINLSVVPARSPASTATEDKFAINLGSLGINTKSTVETLINKNGELVSKLSATDRNTLKYQRLAFAREILYSKEKAEAYKLERHKTLKTMRYDEKENRNIVSSKKTNAQNRTFHCLYDLAKIYTAKGEKAKYQKSDGVSIYKKQENVFLKGQYRCSSVWSCPCCSAQISEGRKEQLQKAFATHRFNGGGVYEVNDGKNKTINETTNGIYMMTLTLPHYKKDVLKDLMFSIRKAVKYLKESRLYKDTLKQYLFIGEVRALEVTYSENNGWHPHFHSILFFDNLLTKLHIKDMKSKLLIAWQRACKKAGLQEPNEKHGLDIQDGSQAQNYVNKWGIEHEITKWTSKQGKSTSISPFQLLDMYSTDIASRMHYAQLFREYVSAFHGFRQLYWSPGLKQKLGVNDLTDEELSDETTEEAIFLGGISVQDWLHIRKVKVFDEKLNTKISLIFYITRIVKELGFNELINIISGTKENNFINVFYEEKDEEIGKYQHNYKYKFEVIQYERKIA